MKDITRVFDHLSVLMGDLDDAVFEQVGDCVGGGPFAGMQIPKKTIWRDGNTSAKLFGTYESELHASILKLLKRPPQVIINVGCAEGYYAIGLARLFQSAIVYALDFDARCLHICQAYALKNAVGSQIIAGLGCQTPAELRFLGVKGRRLYIVDVEGWECTLLDPKECPQLLNSDIIVECHDFLMAETTAVLSERFKETHEVVLVNQAAPNLLNPIVLPEQAMIIRALLLIDKRPHDLCWLVCWAKTRISLFENTLIKVSEVAA